MENSNLKQVESLLEMWNELDVNPIKGLVEDEVFYSSESVMIDIIGKEDVLYVLEKMLHHVKTLLFLGIITLQFEVVENGENNYSLFMRQKVMGKKHDCLFDVYVFDGRIIGISVCPVNSKLKYNLKTQKFA